MALEEYQAIAAARRALGRKPSAAGSLPAFEDIRAGAVGAQELDEVPLLVVDVGEVDVCCAGSGPTWLIADASMVDMDLARGDEELLDWLFSDLSFVDTLALVGP